MDEADKYKQRLEAIAEKRRLQEEQDRARREMEDEKLRLQQLKRKSLRDQWLMEGPPLSPTSLDSHSPRSPLWGSPSAQEIEKHTDKLQSESQRLAEEEEKLKEQMEDGQTEAVNVAEAEAEKLHDAVLQNGEKNAAGLEMIEDEVSTKLSPADEPAAVLTNGRGDLEVNMNPHQSTANGPLIASEGDISVELPLASRLRACEAEPGQVPSVSINEEEEEEEEGTLVMRAERVIITDEGEDAPEELTTQEDQQETEQSGGGQQGGEAVGEEAKPEEAPETLTQPEKSEGAEPTADGDVHDGAKTDEQSEEPPSVQLQSPASALEGTTVASVPVYSESALTPELEAEGAAAASPEGAEAEGAAAASPERAEAAVKAQDGITMPGQFQEVPLADPQESQKTQVAPAEQEPLLSQAKTSNTHAEPRPAAVSTETQSPTRANAGGEGEAPRHKTCQCCSVM